MEPLYAYWYGLGIDKRPTMEIWNAIKNSIFKGGYIEWCVKTFNMTPEEYLRGMHNIQQLLDISN